MKSLESLFQDRLIFLIKLLDEEQHFPDKNRKNGINIYLASKTCINKDVISRILTHKVPAMPYATFLAQGLAPAICKAMNAQANGDAWIQEYWDTFGLTEEYLAIEKQEPRVQFSNRVSIQPELAVNSSNRYLPRPSLTTACLLELLCPDAQGRYRPSILAITGVAGAGKSSLAREICQRGLPFFPGGVLFADIREQKSPRKILTKWWRGLFSNFPPGDCDTTTLAQTIYSEMDKRRLRWLCFLDNVTEGFLAQFPLPATWTILTGYSLDSERLSGDLPKLGRLAPSFSKDETENLIKRQKKDWLPNNDPTKAQEVCKLVEGLPMAVSIIAAILGQRNWEFVFSRLANRKAPPNWFQTTDAGRPPESLWAVIEMALETISAESSEALRAAAFWAPGEVFPLFYLEADDELSTQVDLETALEGLTQAALIETLFWTGQNGFMAHFLRLHRLISLFIYGSTQTAFMRHLNSKALSVLLNQIFLAQNIHIPCQFFLQAFQGRHMAFRHLNDLVNRYKTTPGDFDHQELMLYSMALEAGRLAHSLAGPTEAVTTMERILGRTNSNAYLHNPDVFIQWVEYRLAAGNTARLDERLQDFLSEYGKDLFSVIRAQACQVRLAAVIGDRRQVQSLLQKLERSADRYSLAFSCPPVCRELIFAHVRASLVINQEQVTDEIMQHYIEAIQALGGEILGEPEKTIFMTYPALTTGLETTWELAEALLASDLGELAFWLQREVTRLAIALPWIYALDHFYRYARLAWQIGFFDVAQSLLDYLRQGERACQVDSCRSKILTARFDPDQTSGNQQLEELARSFNKRGQLAWRDEAQKIGTLSLNGTLVSRQRSKGGFSKPFTFYPLHILAKVQNHLHLPDFADDTAPLPRELPW